METDAQITLSDAKLVIGVKRFDDISPMLFVLHMAAMPTSWKNRQGRSHCAIRAVRDLQFTRKRFSAIRDTHETEFDEIAYADAVAFLFSSRRNDGI